MDNSILKFRSLDERRVNSDRYLRNYIYHLNNDSNIDDGIKQKYLGEICNYLDNPIKFGIWTLELKWSDFGGITDEIISDLKIKPEKSDIKESMSVNFQRTEKLKELRKISFLFTLFRYLVLEDRTKKLSQEDFYNNSLSDYRHILQKINISALKEKYKDAIEFYKENIYCPGMFKNVGEDIMYYKKGVFTQNGEIDWSSNSIGMNYRNKTNYIDHVTSIKFRSINRESLEILSVFFEKIGKIDLKEISLMPIFSPEDEVFKPYIYFLDQVYKKVIDEESIMDKFEKAIKEYSDEDYTHSISTIGILAEDILIQIYETFFRESLPKQQGLGQIMDLLNNKVSILYRKEKIEPPDINYLYESVKFLLKAKSSSQKDVLKLNREIINYIKKSSDYQVYSATNTGIKTIFSIFPDKLRDELDELIKYRNSISHKSRIPIDDFESVKSVYICFSLYRWWKHEKLVIEWRDGQNDIIKKVVDRSAILN